MLIRISKLKNFQLGALDGDIGRVRDFLFDDSCWTVRYMVANTGKWLLGRLVLIAPSLMQSPDLYDDKIPLKITKDELEQAPPIEEDQPVSRQYEEAYADYFKKGYYWIGRSVWGMGLTPYEMVVSQDKSSLAESGESSDDDEHLRSVEEVMGYRVFAGGDHVGHVSDFVVDTKNWEVLLVAIDTHKWLPGKHFVLPVPWTADISWVERKVTVDVDAEKLESAPEFDDELADAQIVADLYRHYGR